MKWYTRFSALLLVFVLTFTMSVAAAEKNNLKKLSPTEEAAFFDLVFGDVVNMYQFDVEENEIYKRMITNMLNEDPALLDVFFKALFNSFDDYSEFYLPGEFENFLNNIEGIGGGIGVQIEKANPYVTIVSTIPGGPSEAAGIQPGDRVVSVNGESMEGRSLDYVSYKLRGEIGTTVVVTLLRGDETLEFTLVRGKLSSQTVSYGILSYDTGYLGIYSFSSTSAKEVQDALAYFDAQKIKKIVIDLRDNGGGFVDSAIAIARMLVPQGTIITHYTKANGVSMDYQSYLKETKYTLVTLVNEFSASASEILASALQESGASKLVGAKTYGKAVTQSSFNLYAGRACKLTTGEYFTRNGNKINKVGLKPDIAVNNKLVALKNTDMEPLVYCSAFTPGLEEAGISAYKLRLQHLNYDIGTINNVYDETFKSAVSAYQSANSIKPTGILDITTQIHITNSTDDNKVLVDNQLIAAMESIGSSYNGLREK